MPSLVPQAETTAANLARVLRVHTLPSHSWEPQQDGDPLGVEGFATHHVPLTEAPQAYETFQKKEDGAFKVVFKP